MKIIKKESSEFEYFIRDKTRGEKLHAEPVAIWEKVNEGFKNTESSNLFNQFLIGRMADFNLKEYKVQLNPVDNDDKTIAHVKTLNFVSNSLWKVLEIEKVLDSSLKKLLKYGTSIIKIGWDSDVETNKESKGQIFLEEILVQDFYFDDVQNFKDSSFCIYEQVTDLRKLSNNKALNDSKNKEIVDAIKDTFSEAEEKIKIFHYYLKQNQKIKKFIYLEGIKKVEDLEEIVGLFVEDVFSFDYFPFAVGVYSKIDAGPYGDSMFKYLYNSINTYTKLQNSLQRSAKASTKQLLVFDKNIINDKDFPKNIKALYNDEQVDNNKEDVFVLALNRNAGDNKSTVMIESLATFNKDTSAYSQTLKQELDLLNNTSKISKGETGSMQTTGAVEAAIEQSTAVQKYLADGINYLIKDLIFIILEFVKRYHDVKKKIKVITSDFEEDNFVEYIGTEFKKLGYEIQTDIQPISNYEKEKQNKKLSFIFQQLVQNQNNPTETSKSSLNAVMISLIRNMNFEDKKTLIKKIKAEESAYRLKLCEKIYEFTTIKFVPILLANFKEIIGEHLMLIERAGYGEREIAPEEEALIMQKVTKLLDSIVIPKAVVEEFGEIPEDNTNIIMGIMELLKTI